MDSYEKKYYEYQTKARGLLDENALQQYFEKLSKWYKRRIGQYLPASKNAKCLDVPCGYGNILYFLKLSGYKNSSGIDLDNKQVELANLLGLSATVADVFDVLHEKHEHYDLITSFDFIEHLQKDDALKFLKLCYERLKPDGRLILRTPCADGPFGAHDVWNDLTHQWGLTSNLLKAILEMQGFEKVNIIDERPQPTNVLNIFRWLIFFPSKLVASAFCFGLGMQPPKIWSRSMIAIAYKPMEVTSA